MKHTGYQIRVSAVLELSGNDLADLYRTAKAHYDGECRRYATNIELLMWAYLQRRNETKAEWVRTELHRGQGPVWGELLCQACDGLTETNEYTLTTSDLQVLTKIGEMLPHLPEAHTPSLGIALHLVLNRTIGRSEELNEAEPALGQPT